MRINPYEVSNLLFIGLRNKRLAYSKYQRSAVISGLRLVTLRSISNLIRLTNGLFVFLVFPLSWLSPLSESSSKLTDDSTFAICYSTTVTQSLSACRAVHCLSLHLGRLCSRYVLESLWKLTESRTQLQLTNTDYIRWSLSLRLVLPFSRKTTERLILYI